MECGLDSIINYSINVQFINLTSYNLQIFLSVCLCLYDGGYRVVVYGKFGEDWSKTLVHRADKKKYSG